MNWFDKASILMLVLLMALIGILVVLVSTERITEGVFLVAGLGIMFCNFLLWWQVRSNLLKDFDEYKRLRGEKHPLDWR